MRRSAALRCGGVEEWGTASEKVEVVGGLFRVLLGTHEPLSAVPFDQPYWLKVQVHNRNTQAWEVLSPRSPLASAPYAFRKKEVEADGVGTAALEDESVTTEKLAYRYVTNDKIATQALNGRTIAYNAITTNYVMGIDAQVFLKKIRLLQNTTIRHSPA